ncbi:pseudaminic acid cytidylyltransferase [Leptospira levettii]|uniref:pseudaminic acid cytidylyltransferase n=1 Tax=Leptospira levettii TaxID=2023178 RepID=UPI00108299FD|nr:pseudaminic acid cytidylyltransferase [Leptospira levettii]TGM89525.1 pseudaminic acid cytidylyltransferase [Leptospira levettii]
MKEIIAIIPARGGSKRIPRKNIKNFCGKPVISYAISNALQSNLFSEVMVSTDDEEIGQVAKIWGANVPFFRSKENSTDFSSTIDVILEVIANYEMKGRFFEYGCCIYPCTPLLKRESLIESCDMLFSNDDTDVVIPILRYSHPIQRALTVNIDSRIEQVNPEMMKIRTQDLQVTYHDAGQFYFFKTESLKKYKTMWCPKVNGLELKEIEAQDIDTIDDWKLAELKFQLLDYN